MELNPTGFKPLILEANSVKTVGAIFETRPNMVDDDERKRVVQIATGYSCAMLDVSLFIPNQGEVVERYPVGRYIGAGTDTFAIASPDKEHSLYGQYNRLCWKAWTIGGIETPSW